IEALSDEDQESLPDDAMDILNNEDQEMSNSQGIVNESQDEIQELVNKIREVNVEEVNLEEDNDNYYNEQETNYQNIWDD
ncbi:15828_t:CDS:1, partial [Dentiscutata heterogama]